MDLRVYNSNGKIRQYTLFFSENQFKTIEQPKDNLSFSQIYLVLTKKKKVYKHHLSGNHSFVLNCRGGIKWGGDGETSFGDLGRGSNMMRFYRRRF